MSGGGIRSMAVGVGPVCSWGPCEASEQSNALSDCYVIHPCCSALSGLRIFYLGHSNLPRTSFECALG